MKPVYIAGTGMTQFGKLHEPLIDLLVHAAEDALSESEHLLPDALYVGLMNPEGFVGDSNFAAWLTDRLGLSGIPAMRVEATSSTGAAVLHEAFQAVASGNVKRALVVAGDAMTHLPTRKVTQLLSQVIAAKDRQAGATMPALAAMVTQRWMHDAKLSDEDCRHALMKVAVKNHEMGQFNDRAQFRKPISEEKYFDSRMVSSPLCLYDCAPITDGAAAMLLTSDSTDIRIWGIGQGTDTLSMTDREELTSFRSTRAAALRAYHMAGRGPQTIQFAEIHDAFIPFEVLSLEDTGLMERDTSAQAELDEVTHINGKLPTNISGGLKARGHPVSTSGLAQVIEAVKQMRGQVDEAVQLKRTGMALCQSTGGLFNQSFVTILGKPRARKAAIESEMIQQLHVPERLSLLNGKRPRRQTTGEVETFTYLNAPAEGFPSPMLLALVNTKGGNHIIARGDPERPVEIGQTVHLKKIEASGEGGPYYFTDDAERVKQGEVSVKMLDRKPKGPLSQVKDFLSGTSLKTHYFAVKRKKKSS